MKFHGSVEVDGDYQGLATENNAQRDGQSVALA